MSAYPASQALFSTVGRELSRARSFHFTQQVALIDACLDVIPWKRVVGAVGKVGNLIEIHAALAKRARPHIGL
jgi:hypothetical protein